jgi:predicted helicase
VAAARSTATNKNSLYDSYIRAFRWATDLIKDRGVIGFVSNGGFIDGNTADGLRKTFASEFTSIYIYNQRTAGELSRREGGKVFGGGSRNTVAITLLVKNPAKNVPAVLHYKDIGDYLSREQKLAIVAKSAIDAADWSEITPNAAGDWINQRNDSFQDYAPMADKDNGTGIFRIYSGGLKTNRDAWAYNASRAELENNVGHAMDFYNAEVGRYESFCKEAGIGRSKDSVDDFINTDPRNFSWDRADKTEPASAKLCTGHSTSSMSTSTGFSTTPSINCHLFIRSAARGISGLT